MKFYTGKINQTRERTQPTKLNFYSGWSGLVHTSDGIGSGVGIRSARSVTIQCKSKIGIGSGVGSSTESESEGSEEFLFLPIPLPLPSLPIQWEQGERNRNRKRDYQPIKKTHCQFLSNLEQEKNGGSRGKTGRGWETDPRSLWKVLQGLQRQQQKKASMGQCR